MRILSRYILRETLPLFVLCAVFLTLLFLVHRIFHWMDLILNKGVPFGDAFRLYLTLIPLFLSMTVPMAVLLGVLLATSRLSADLEVVALKSSGVHVGRLVGPLAAAAFVLSLAMAAFNHGVLPRSNFAFKKLYFDIVRQRAHVAVRERVIIDDFEGYRFYVDRRDKTGLLEDVQVFSRPSKEGPVWTTLARTGRLVSEGDDLQVSLVLRDGVVLWSRADDFKTYHHLRFEKHVIPLLLNAGSRDLAVVGKESQEMDLRELLEGARKSRQSDRALHLRLRAEFHKRLALPFACLVVTWFSAPLGLWFRRRGAMAFSLGILVIFLYYLVFVWGEVSAQRGAVPAALGLWAANAVFALVGMAFFRLAANERPSLLPWPARRREPPLRRRPGP